METIETRASKWLLSGDTGASSKALCGWMLHGKAVPRHAHPHDGGDLGRCVRLLDLIPEWKPRIPEMAKHGPYWAALATRWDDLVTTLAADQSPHHNHTYNLIRSILDPVQKADSSVINLGNGMTMRFGGH